MPVQSEVGHYGGGLVERAAVIVREPAGGARPRLFGGVTLRAAYRGNAKHGCEWWICVKKVGSNSQGAVGGEGGLEERGVGR